MRPGSRQFWRPFGKAFTAHNIKSAFISTGLWPVDFDRVRDQVYNLTGEEEATALEGPSDQPASTRESRVSKRAHHQVEQEVLNRQQTSEEIRLEAQVIQKRRELENWRKSLRAFKVAMTTWRRCA